MTTSLLKEKSRTTNVKAEQVKDGYSYAVNYDFVEEGLQNLTCNITHLDDNVYAGYMSYDKGNTSFNFPEKAEITVHIYVFEDILTEVKRVVSE